MARAPALQAGGRGFEPHILHESGDFPARFFDRMGKESRHKHNNKTHERTRRAETRAE